MFKSSLDLTGLDAGIDKTAANIKERANKGVAVLWEQLYQEVQINLSNNILNIRTGNLIGSLEYTSYIESYADVINAVVGLNTVYAAYQEFGYQGVINTARGSRKVNYAGRHPVGIALNEIAKNVAAVLSVEVNNA